MNFSSIQEIFITKAGCVRRMIMRNCLMREIIITQKNPVMINCLYGEIFTTKMKRSWIIPYLSNFSLRTSSCKTSDFCKRTAPSRRIPDTCSFPRICELFLFFCRGYFLPHAVFLDRVLRSQALGHWLRGFFSYTGKFLEKIKLTWIGVRGKLLQGWNILETEKCCRGKLLHTWKILDKKRAIEDFS